MDKKPGWLIGFNYDGELVEALKDAIPHTEREWRRSDREWWVSVEYEDVLGNLFGNFEAFRSQLEMF